MGPPRQYIYPNTGVPVGPVFLIERQICLFTRRAEACQSLFGFRSIPLLTPANLPPLESQPIKPSFVFRGLTLLSAGTHGLSSVNVCERDAAVYCTVPVHSGGVTQEVWLLFFFCPQQMRKFLPDLYSLLTETSQGPRSHRCVTIDCKLQRLQRLKIW